MYQPDRYKKNELDFIKPLIRKNPFGEFIIQGSRLLATHIPLLIDDNSETLRLYGHIANHNPQYTYLKDGIEALLIFKGPDAYISSSWYENKDISTWDYSAVHIQCKLKIQNDRELETSLKKLIHHFERDQQQPLEYEDIPDSIIKANFPQITGFWCEPILIEGIGKWHQGFSKKDLLNITNHLETTGCPHHQQLKNNIKQEHDL